MGNMAELFTEEHVWHPLCCHGTAYQRSSFLSHLCHLIFIPIKPLFHNSFLSLSCLNLLLFPLFVLQSVYSVFFSFLTLDLFPCDSFFASSQYLCLI